MVYSLQIINNAKNVDPEKMTKFYQVNLSAAELENYLRNILKATGNSLFRFAMIMTVGDRFSYELASKTIIIITCDNKE